MSGEPQKISVVLPIQNEAELVLDGMETLFCWLRGLDWELVLIDLGSVDGSLELVEPFEDYANVKLIPEEEQLGKGHGHRLGALVSSGDVILLADLQRPIHTRPLAEDLTSLATSDLLLYTPMHPEGTGYGFRSRLYARRLHKVFHAKDGKAPLDPDGSVVAMARKVAMRLFPFSFGDTRIATYELLQLSLKLGFSFSELPVDGSAWPQPGWIELGANVREARRATRRLVGV